MLVWIQAEPVGAAAEVFGPPCSISMPGQTPCIVPRTVAESLKRSAWREPRRMVGFAPDHAKSPSKTTASTWRGAPLDACCGDCATRWSPQVQESVQLGVEVGDKPGTLTVRLSAVYSQPFYRDETLQAFDSEAPIEDMLKAFFARIATHVVIHT